jgi:phosphoribosylaminoimidazolecarboxamide formyltransferase/IMP cyclohydrolase
MKKRALVSVSDKTGLVSFVKGLIEQDIEVISTGGTFSLLKEAGLAVLAISEVSGFPEILDGRVKTLHPNIHAGLLAVVNNPEHVKQIDELNIRPIDYVVVNLYPFKETISKPDVSWNEAIENIDIGGPSMLRSAAKNHESVTVVVDPNDYENVLAQIEKGGTTLETRRALAAKVFRHTASTFS